MDGVPVREGGEFERSEAPDEVLCDARGWFRGPGGGGVPASDRDAASPLPSKMDYCRQISKRLQICPASVIRTFFFGPCPELLTRFRLLITSVLRLIGRGLPCSFRKSPQALQSTDPISSRRQSGVVEVVQF